jgi:FKBP-type peptidyl-prolyl cis-trans isomerase FkpA
MKMKIYLFTFYLFVGCLGIVSCSKDEDQEVIDRRLIQEYIAEHNLVVDSSETGLYYFIEVPGTGGHPKLTDLVQIGYKGSLLNGTVFDEQTSSNIYLDSVIPGWQEGIPLFGRDGKGLLLIPSHLGYGNRNLPGIPANSVLIFEIHLIDF